MESAQLSHRVAGLYERHPYPSLGLFEGLFQRVRREERQTLNYHALYGAAWGSTEGAAERPRILVAGCGTFEAVVVALANPGAEVVAVDVSARSLRIARRQARFRGLGGRITFAQHDLLALPESLGTFDYVVATGVLHHLPDPAAGLRALVARASPRAVFRCMIYSACGRSLLYATKELARRLGVHTPAGLRALVASLPAAHPFRAFFHLYSDTASDGGLADGYLHPCDHAFTARELRELLAGAGLEAALFLSEGGGGSPDWDALGVSEALGELDENFRFVARRAGARAEASAWAWNQALPKSGSLPSRILGRDVRFDTRFPPEFLPDRLREELVRGLFLVPVGRRS